MESALKSDDSVDQTPRSSDDKEKEDQKAVPKRKESYTSASAKDEMDDISKEELLRIERRKLSNRISARASYRRRKHLISKMQDDALTISQENFALRGENGDLQKEKKELQNHIGILLATIEQLHANSHTLSLHSNVRAARDVQRMLQPSTTALVLARDAAVLDAKLKRLLQSSVPDMTSFGAALPLSISTSSTVKDNRFPQMNIPSSFL